MNLPKNTTGDKSFYEYLVWEGIYATIAPLKGLNGNQFTGQEMDWPGSCLATSQQFMSSRANVLQSESAPRRGRKPKTRRKTGAGKKTTTGSHVAEPELAAPGSLTRTKALLLAALRVWELKHRIGD